MGARVPPFHGVVGLTAGVILASPQKHKLLLLPETLNPLHLDGSVSLHWRENRSLSPKF